MLADPRPEALGRRAQLGTHLPPVPGSPAKGKEKMEEERSWAPARRHPSGARPSR